MAKPLFMLHSMTGFGRAQGSFGSKNIRVEIRSLNSKNLDANLKLPSLYKEKELEVRGTLTQALKRGKVDFSVYIEDLDSGEARVLLNKAVVKNYFEQLQSTAQELNDAPTALLPHILSLPDVFQSKQQELQADEWSAVQAIIADACTAINNFREQEGESLYNDFKHRLEEIRARLAEVQQRLPQRKENVRQRLLESLKNLKSELADENRFEQELIYYLEKLDISEEEVRLTNHLNYFEETMNTSEQCGRKLGFIAQEIGREINTMGSKANDADIQKQVVLMKDELEKIKEQVLNVL